MVIGANFYQGLVNSLHDGEGRAKAVGKQMVRPSLFIRGQRNMRHRGIGNGGLVNETSSSL